MNHYPTRRLRISIGTGRTALDKMGLTGKTNQTLARVQWVYERAVRSGMGPGCRRL